MDIYPYEDYRKFLHDAFAEKRKQAGKLTARQFAAAAGFTNPGFFNDVIKGKRTLSDSAADKMVAAFGLKPNEAEYFKLLVAYGQSKRSQERDELYRQMLFRRNRSSFVRLNPINSKYYQDYHYPLIRSAIMVFDFRGNYDALARFIRPAIPLATVKKCVRDLCEWGLLKQDAEGRYRPTYQHQEPAPSMGDLVKRLNKEWVVQAADALFTHTKEERYIYSALLAINEKTYHEIMQTMDKFREQIVELAKPSENPDRVMQFNIQYFPRTQIKESK
jgi:uncharacterized protein (TIGR02147 family)